MSADIQRGAAVSSTRRTRLTNRAAFSRGVSRSFCIPATSAKNDAFSDSRGPTASNCRLMASTRASYLLEFLDGFEVEPLLVHEVDVLVVELVALHLLLLFLLLHLNSAKRTQNELSVQLGVSSISINPSINATCTWGVH